MVEESNLKYWRDAGHVARRTLEAMKDELQPGKTFHEIIEAAIQKFRRFITAARNRRNFFGSSAFVKRSTMLKSVGMCPTSSAPDSTHSRRKWWRRATCLILLKEVQGAHQLRCTEVHGEIRNAGS